MKKSTHSHRKKRWRETAGAHCAAICYEKSEVKKFNFKFNKTHWNTFTFFNHTVIDDSNSYNLWFLWIFRVHSSYSTRSEHRTVTDRSHRSVQSPLHESSRKLVRFLLFQLHRWSYLGFEILIWSSKTAPFCRISSEFLKNSHIFSF